MPYTIHTTVTNAVVNAECELGNPPDDKKLSMRHSLLCSEITTLIVWAINQPSNGANKNI